jgi:hypothetical protein
MCETLPAIHAYTGCDTVSAFAGKGKVNALKLVMASKVYQNTFVSVGKDWTISSKMVNDLEKFTCHLYGARDGLDDINECRYRIFCTRKGTVEPHHLPPCRDALRKHIARTNYQTAIWRNCLASQPNIPGPESHGWQIVDNDDGSQTVEVIWMDGQPAPDAILEFLSCTCSKDCLPQNCVCIRNGLLCTDMCKLSNCSNCRTDADNESQQIDNSSDSDSDNNDDN